MDDPRQPPSMDALVELCAQLAPGSHPEGVERLGGGLDAAMHTVDLVQPSGTRLELVVRRYPPSLLAREPGIVNRSWRTMQVLQQLGLNAPRPIQLEADSRLFGAPAIVMTRLAGQGDLRPADLHGWLVQLAGGIAAIHRAPLTGIDLSFLPQPGHQLEYRLPSSRANPASFEEDADSAAVVAALERWAPRLRRMAPVLVHGDYWAGNTLWQEGRLTAVVDWDNAGVDYPGTDVGYCRLDLALLMGGAAPRLFLEAYEAAAGRRVPQLFFWDLLGALAALPDPARWLPGYHELGRPEITPEIVRERLHAFIEDALTRAGPAS